MPIRPDIQQLVNDTWLIDTHTHLVEKILREFHRAAYFLPADAALHCFTEIRKHIKGAFRRRAFYSRHLV